jgi:hypothetical protein
MTLSRRRFAVMTAALPALLAVAPALAQGSTPVVVEAGPAGVLGQVQVGALPSPRAEVWFLRFMLDPGGSMPGDLQIGPTVAVIESGELALVTDQPVEIDGDAPMATAAADAEGEWTTIATAGQVVYVHEDTMLAVRNDGDAPVSFLTLLTFSPERETESMNAGEAAGTPPAEPVGFSQEPVGLTVAEFPEGPGTITIERIVLESSETARTDVPGGAIAGGVEQGSLAITLDAGNGFLWPDMMEPLGPAGGDQAPERIDLASGDSGALAARDGFGCWDAGIDWQAGGDGATILQVRIEPAMTATPAG